MPHRIADLITRWVLLIKRHGKISLGLILGVSALAAVAGAQLFSLNSDVGKLIRPSDDTRWYAQNEAHKAAFPQFENTAIVVVSGPRAAVDKASRELLNAFDASGWYHSISAPGLDPFFDEHGLYFMGLDEVEDLSADLSALLPAVEPLTTAGLAGYFALLDTLLAAAPFDESAAAAAELFTGKLADAIESPGQTSVWLAAPDEPETGSHYQMIALQGRQLFGEKSPARAVIEETRRIIDATAHHHDDVLVRLTGELAMADEELRTALSGIQFAGLLSLLLLALILSVGVRSWSIVLAIFLLLACGIALTTLFASLVVGSFNTLSLVFLVMFFGLGVDFALHYALRIEESLSARAEQQDALRHATLDIGTALLLCTITSGMAFLSFFPTEYRGLAELGIISAGGMVIAFIMTVTLIPAWFSVVGMPAPWRPAGGRRLHFGLDRLRPNTVLVITVLISLGAGWFAKDVRFDYSVLAMRDKSSEAITTLLELQERELATDYSIAVLAEQDSIEPLKAAFLALPTVATVTTPSDAVPEHMPEKAAALSRFDALADQALVLPESQGASALAAAAAGVAPRLTAGTNPILGNRLSGLSASQLLQLETDLVKPLLDDLAALRPKLMAKPFGLNDLPASLTSRLVAPDGRHRLEVIAADQLNDLEAMDRFVSEVESVAPNIAGRTVVERGVGQSVVRSFNTAVVIALSCIIIVLLMYFREPLTPLLVLIPLGLTTLFTFAIIELTGLTLNMANILVVPLIFGLGVDTGIHVVHRYHHANSVAEVLRSSTPRAVTLSALTTIGTFFSLSFSPHKGAASIGLILSIAIAILMVVTFVVLPALLARFEPQRRWGRNRPGHGR